MVYNKNLNKLTTYASAAFKNENWRLIFYYRSVEACTDPAFICLQATVATFEGPFSTWHNDLLFIVAFLNLPWELACQKYHGYKEIYWAKGMHIGSCVTLAPFYCEK